MAQLYTQDGNETTVAISRSPPPPDQTGPKVNVEVIEEGKTVVVRVGGIGPNLKMSDIKLDVGVSMVSLLLPGGIKRAVTLPAVVDPDSARAAFKKKTGTIQLSLMKAGSRMCSTSEE